MSSRQHQGRGIPAAWRLAEALEQQPGLSLVPGASKDVTVAGELWCRAVGPGDVLIDTTYSVKICIPRDFPRSLPQVYETGGRIPRDFHRHPDESLCVGSPIAQRLELDPDPTIGNYIGRIVVPYLYGHAYHLQFGKMPFGELRHGAAGLEDDVRKQFGLPSGSRADELLRLAGIRRRHANKQPCPCGSGIRTGRCHNAAVNSARQRLGRRRCREQLAHLRQLQGAERNYTEAAFAAGNGRYKRGRVRSSTHHEGVAPGPGSEGSSQTES